MTKAKTPKPSKPLTKPAQTKPAQTKPAQTKQSMLIGLLKRKRGATINEMSEATGWLPHSIRGAISGTLKKKLSLEVTTEDGGARGRFYRIAG